MGTRSLTFVHADTDSDPVICVYQQYDGYFDGVGEKILAFLKGSQIVNGIPGGASGTVFNGPGDLAARLVTMFKGGDDSNAGGVYIEPSSLKDGDMGTEFAYHIFCEVGKPPALRAVDIYQSFTIEGSVDEFVWPQQDDDGNYVVAPVDNSGPMTAEQRKALFALWRIAFDDGGGRVERHAFTRAVLGANVRPSWSAAGNLTTNQASRLLDVLGVVAAIS
jgi:hypothetical protein